MYPYGLCGSKFDSNGNMYRLEGKAYGQVWRHKIAEYIIDNSVCHENEFAVLPSPVIDINILSMDKKNPFVLVELSKKKINVALNGDQFGDENIIVDDSPFKSTLIYVNSEGVSVDLLQLYGAQTHIGHYVALVMDKLFTFEEITTITKDELVKDERYLIIKGKKSSTGNVTVQPAPQVALHDDFDEFIGSFAN
ncbi:unnamed protein product [Adineta steineri]|uniref:Uncharacterized protein n=1 Tax=Adineta steineri TaxID=433720 RepID=A0A815F8C6_9BILA|nr:unnamed protein product [Adineta steineri]CAF1584632.1 unnamed protein product [Adineta steineri]